MEKLLQQIRDNQRFENWCCFPGNSLCYSYNDSFVDKITKIEYKREDKVIFYLDHQYDEWGNLLCIKHVSVIKE